MEILYISSVPSKNEFFSIKEKIRDGISATSYGMAEAGFKFHSLIQSGLVADSDTHVYSLVGRSISYKTHQGINWKAKSEEIGGIRYKHLAVVNLPVVKQFVMAIMFFFNTLEWLKKHKNSDDKFILIDAAYVTVIPSVLLAAHCIKCKKAGIFADIYEYMGKVTNDQAKHKIISKIMRRIISQCYDNFDGFILITEKANNVVNRYNKPYIVMEGLVDIDMNTGLCVDSKMKKQPKTVLYAGALREQYGLKNLIDGFIHYKNDDVRLDIYGDGDYIPEIVKATKIDPRIKFMGLADNEIIIKKETQATLLVNPRPIDQEFTQYSFPSKNMEYMVSGTPVLTTKLPGMPDEYYDFIYTIDGDSADDVTQALETVLAIPNGEMARKGNSAREFVLKNKNNIMQAGRIVKLLKGHINEKTEIKETHTSGLFRKISQMKSLLFSFFSGNNETALSFQYSGIMRYVPLMICGGVFIFSILLFAFGPLDWNIKNGFKLYGFLISCVFALCLGYFLAVKTGKTSTKKVNININRLFILCGIVFIIVYIPTVYVRTGKFYPDIYTGLKNAGVAYRMSQFYADYGSQLLEYIRVLLGPLTVMVMPLTLFFMPKLSKTGKILGIVTIILTAFLGISMGRIKNCADITAQVVLYLTLLFFSKKEPGKNFTHKMKTMLLIILVCGLFFSYYTVTMRSRVSMDSYLGSQTVLDNQGIDDSLNEYSTMSSATEKEKNVLLGLLPDRLESSALFLSSYISHGYKGLSIAMDQEFSCTYGLGFSEFLSRNFLRAVGNEQLMDKIEKMTYAGKTMNEGWVTGAVWSTFFVFPASDITFFGTILLVFMIGYLWALSWKDALRTHNPFAIAIFFNFCIMVIYFSANNQVFQTGENTVGFIVLFAAWMVTRRVAMKKENLVLT